MPRATMTVQEAKQVVADVLAQHGDEVDLRQLLNSVQEPQRSLLARMFSELRRKGDIKTRLEVNPATGEVSHRVRQSGDFAPAFNTPDTNEGDS